MYLSCVYMPKFANAILQRISFREFVSLFFTIAFIIKNKDKRKNANAKPSNAPPLNNWVILKNANLDWPIIKLNNREKIGEFKNKLSNFAKIKVLIT